VQPRPDDCPHCDPRHGDPHRCSWSAYVAREVDGDGQPTHLRVQPTNGAHVAESDAQWVRDLLHPGPWFGWWMPLPQSAPGDAPMGCWTTTLGGRLIVSRSEDGITRYMRGAGHGCARRIPQALDAQEWASGREVPTDTEVHNSVGGLDLWEVSDHG